jgi:pyruvate/2-oxoglutarate dehydrogenase complex dihydrolipoamide acyltransferase (E2) component
LKALTVEIKMPGLGENVTEGTITHWLKQVGEPIREGEVLVEVMTEKVSLDVESTVSGIVIEIIAPEESIVRVGAVIARIQAETQ